MTVNKVMNIRYRFLLFLLFCSYYFWSLRYAQPSCIQRLGHNPNASIIKSNNSKSSSTSIPFGSFRVPTIVYHITRAFSSRLLHAIITRNQLPFFKIFSIIVHLWPNSHIFCPLLSFFKHFFALFALFLKNRMHALTFWNRP